ncbi:MAG: acyl-CoA dehydrogenase family protein [Acidimicrobiales bacterium]
MVARLDTLPPVADIDGLRGEVAEWIAENRVAGLDAEQTGAHPPYAHELGAPGIEWLDRLREGRWLCLSWPECYGGRSLSAVDCIAVNEEFARAGVPRFTLGMGESLVAPAILTHGTEEQRSRLLPRILDGTDRYCQGFSEPDSGSDLAHLRTIGVIDGEELAITGTKVWTSDAQRANTMFALCRTDPAASDHRGISYVIVPMADNHVTVAPIRQMSGTWGFNQVHLDGSRASLHDVIGGLHGGWRVAMTTLGAERAGMATVQYLGYEREWRALVDDLRASEPLGPTVRQALSRSYSEIEIMRFSGLRIGAGATTPEATHALLAIDKLFWSEFHQRFGELAMQLNGLEALTSPPGPAYPLRWYQRVFLESRARTIARGSSEIQRNLIAERVLGLPRS